MKKMDLILILTIIFIMSIVYFIYNSIPKSNASYIIITLASKEYKRISIMKNETVIINDNKQHNIIVIENGQAYMKEANCPDHICIKHPPIKLSGEVIVCLPNRVMVKVI